MSARLGIVIILLLGALPALARTHKVRVSDPKLAAQLESQGAKLLADYGSFQLLETTAVPSLVSIAATSVEPADESDFIELNAGALDTRVATVMALRKPAAAFAGKKLHLVQFVGPIKPEWREALEQTGVSVVHYVPQNAYLVRGDYAALTKLQSWAATADYLQWEGDFADNYKVHPRARLIDTNGVALTPATDVFAIQLVNDPEANASTLALLDQIKLEPIRQQYEVLNYLNIIVRVPPDQISKLAAQPEVVSIRPHVEPKRRDERQGQIMAGNLTGNIPSGPGYLAWLASKGFTQSQFDASGFVVDVTDSGIDNGTSSPGHFGLYRDGAPSLGSRVAYNRLEGTPNAGSTLQGCDGHGNLNSHIIAGFNDMTTAPHLDAAGYHYGLGICPFVKVGSSVIFDSSNFTSPSYPNLAARAYRDGARVSNNSWGADTAGDYDADAQAYDALVRDAQPSGSAVATVGNQQMVICFAAGNAGSAAGTVGSPGTAKNVIVVGATENVRSHSTANGGNSSVGDDGCTTLDTEADSSGDIATFSSRGPCADGRQKPDLVAPGTHVTGGAPQSILTTNGTGTAISCFDGTGVCGLPGGGTTGNANNFFPLGQQFYTTSSGTSHSTPGVAGACALLRQYFINAALNPPSPAMTKAFLVNAARYLTGTSAADRLPSPNQGMGAVNLGTAFDGVARVLHDQVASDKFTASGQTRTINGTVVDPSKPFRVTLAWTDAPGNTTGNAYNNNLDLTVTVGGNTYKGNVFALGTGLSSPGATADSKNNLESVFRPAGTTGAFSVTVTAANINSDGVPNEAPALDQDYALVIYNAAEAVVPAISEAGYAISAESCAAPNNAVDPGETVTLNFGLHNVGLADTTNLVATLLETGGVSFPSSAQTYGALLAGGSSVTQAFSFTAVGSCGSNVVATLALTDGTNNLGTVAFTIPLGILAVQSSQNFDGVTAPALPAGWASTASGGQATWVTTGTAKDTAPYAAYSTDAATAGVNELVSQVFTLGAGPSQLSFQHRFELEPTYDGGVLEIKMGTGDFVDILAAGGTFMSGGYNSSVSSGNALGARAAWSGTNASFSPVVVNLPTAAAGQNIQLRWRCGTDTSVARAGWWVDSIALQATVCCGGGSAPIINVAPQNQTVIYGSPWNLSVGAIGDSPLNYQWFQNNLPIPDATNASFSIASATPTDAGGYFVTITNSFGSITSSVATVTVITAPVILTNPASLLVSAGASAGFTVSAVGAPPLSYQWQFNGADLLAATNATHSIASVQPGDAGSYSVVVTNFAGSITSAPAVLSLTPVGEIVVLAGWDVSAQTAYGSSPLPPTTNAAGVIVGGLTRGAGVTTVSTAASRAWGGNGFNAASEAAAVTAEDFATCSLSAVPGYTVSYSAISRFDYRRSSSGPPNGVLQYQVGAAGFLSLSNVSYASTASSGASLPPIDLSAVAALQNVPAGIPVTFRLVNYGASTSGGNWYLYDVANSAAVDFAITGILTPIFAPPAEAPTLSLWQAASNQFQFTLSGTVSSNYVIESATNLVTPVWSPVYTGAAPFQFSEPATEAQRFYRGKIR